MNVEHYGGSVSEVAMHRWHNVAGLLFTVWVTVLSLTLALHRHCSSVVSLLLDEGSRILFELTSDQRIRAATDLQHDVRCVRHMVQMYISSGNGAHCLHSCLIGGQIVSIPCSANSNHGHLICILLKVKEKQLTLACMDAKIINYSCKGGTCWVAGPKTHWWKAEWPLSCSSSIIREQMYFQAPY